MPKNNYQLKHARLNPLPLLCVLVLPAPALFAQVPNYNIGDAVRDANAPDPAKEPVKPAGPPKPIIIQQDEKPLSLSEGQKIAIRDFRVEDADFLDAQDLSRVLEPYRNRELTIGEINEAANRVTVFARSKGYLVARAYVPKQDVKDGVLVIKLMAGKYGSFQMKNRSLVRDFLLQRLFDKTKDSSAIVTRDGLERPMLLVSDMPGAQMPLVSIAPGNEPGTSDFTIETEATDRVTGYALVDNYGSRFTGKNRLSAGLTINSPFGIGDRFSLSGLTSPDSGLQNGRGAYSFPLSFDGLRGEIAASRTTYKLGAEYADLDATGVAESVEATISYPIKRTREDTLIISLTAASKRMHDDINLLATITPKRAKVATLRLERQTYGRLFGLNSYTNLSGGLTFGRLDFDDPAQRALNVAGANTVGSYSKVNVSFIGNVAFDGRWSLAGSLQAQQSLGKNLDGSEQFSISGPSGIKSYPDGVVSDNGYLVGGELKYAFTPIANIDHSVGFFVNHGAVRPEDGRFTSVGRVAISDVGIAYYISDKRFFGRVQLAQTLGTQTETRNYNHDFKVLAQIGMRF